MNTSHNKTVLKRLLSDLLNGETVGASDGKRYGVSWLANYATELRYKYGVKIVSKPKGDGLKGYYVLLDKAHAEKTLQEKIGNLNNFHRVKQVTDKVLNQNVKRLH
jgi:hypothetical protein